MIVSEIKELDAYWNDVIFNVCEGKPSEMSEIKKFNIFDFFAYVDKKNS